MKKGKFGRVIDVGVRVNVVMDYIEGASIKILTNRYGVDEKSIYRWIEKVKAAKGIRDDITAEELTTILRDKRRDLKATRDKNTKKCSKCGRKLEVTRFRKGRNQCKDCEKAYMKNYWKNRKSKGGKKNATPKEAKTVGGLMVRVKALEESVKTLTESVNNIQKAWMSEVEDLHSLYNEIDAAVFGNN